MNHILIDVIVFISLFVIYKLVFKLFAQMSLYEIYRTIQSKKHLFVVRRHLEVRFTFGKNFDSVQSRFKTWKIMKLI